MLGRLRMGVDKCISAYERLFSQIFVKERLGLSWSFRMKGRFSTNSLEACLREIIKKHTGGRSAEQELLNNGTANTEGSCKV